MVLKFYVLWYSNFFLLEVVCKFNYSIEPSGSQTKLNPTAQDQLPPRNPEADPNSLKVTNDSKQSQDLEGPATVKTNATSKAEALVRLKGEFLYFP